MNSILVVDDEPDIVALISYNLKKAGYAVSSASDGEEALASVREGRFDLIVLDLMLPGIHGMERCRILRAALEKPAHTRPGRPLRPTDSRPRE